MRLQKEELATVVILGCALLAIAVLYLMTAWNPYGSYSPTSKDGDTVSVSGTILTKETTKTGGHIILDVKTDIGPVTVFVPASCDSIGVAQKAEPGRQVKATGKVQTYKGEREIVASMVATT